MKQLSIVIPIYNEEAILEKEIIELVLQMEQILPGLPYELILVENGSFDRTRHITEELERLYPTVVRGVYLPSAGYGRALKQGLIESNGMYTVLFNIDFWDINFIRKALTIFKEKSVDMVVGSKVMVGAEDSRPWFRRLITRSFNRVLRALFGFSGTDTHGMKVLVRERMLPVVIECKTEREIFDTEFILRAQSMGLTSEEVPVVCIEKRNTTYNIAKRVPRTIKDMLTLFVTLPNQRARRLSTAILLSSIVLFFGVIFSGFPDRPGPWFDEGVNLGIAKTYAEDGVFSLRLAPEQYVQERGLMISTNYPVLAPLSLFFYIFGVGLAQAKLVMILFLIGFLIVGYCFVRSRSNHLIASFSIFLVVTFLPLYGNGLGGGLGEVPGLFFLLLGLLLFEKNKSWHIFLAGLSFGLCASTKVFYLVVLAALGVAEIWWAIKERRFLWKRWLLLGFGILLPLILWLRTLLPNWSIEGIMHTVSYYHNPYNITLYPFVNFIKFFTESTPIHFTLCFFALLCALYFRAHAHRLRRADIIIITFVLLTIVWFLRTPGWYRYFFPAHLIVLLLLPNNLFEIGTSFVRRRFAIYGVSFLVILLGVVHIFHMLHEYDTRLYYNPEPRLFAESLTKELGNSADIFVIDQPEFWFLLRDRNAGQYMQMNPYIAFGRPIFENTRALPTYIVSGDPERNQYLSSHRDELSMHYILKQTRGQYYLFEKR